VPDSSGEDLRGGVKFPTGGIARDPVVVKGMCSTLRCEFGANPQDPTGGSGATPGPTVTVWMEEGPLHQDISDPKAYAFGFFYGKEA
jgi:hypothetical protein